MLSELEKIGHRITAALRHDPGKIGITLDAHGWADVHALINGINRVYHAQLTMEMLEEIVATNNKQRYSFDQDKQHIRANQGHSKQLNVDVELPVAAPPAILYHGTSRKALDAILREGLSSRTRQHVHLSPDIPTALKVGSRHGAPVVLEVRAGEMAAAGHVFYLSVNGVWLTEQVPPAYLRPLLQESKEVTP